MKVKNILTKGLQEGFGGGTVRKGVFRGGFDIDSSHFEKDGAVYHDEWAAARAGGGQELVEVGGKRFTRVYAGGTIPEEELAKLGIGIDDVMRFLKKQIIENGPHIRLYDDYEFEDGDWRYQYKVLEKEEAIPMTTGKETIFFKNDLVFQHNFILCPVD